MARAFASISSARMALAFLFKWLGGHLARSAPPEGGTEDVAYVKAIPASATVSVADSRPGEGVARTVFYDTPGPLALPLEIGGSMPLICASCLAFGEPGQTIMLRFPTLSAPGARRAGPAG